MIEPVLTGVRLALIALYCLVFWRLIFFSWKITAQPEGVRQQGWFWFRWHVALLSISVVFFYSPMDILRAAEMISIETRMLMSLGGSLINAVCAVCLLVGLDVATGNKARSFPFYLAMIFVAIFWMIYRE